jgi:hypothetical protein
MLRQQGLDTTTLAGNAISQMMGVFAEFERAGAGPRQDARPPHHQRCDRCRDPQGAQEGRRRYPQDRDHAGVGTGTVQRIKAEMTA